jgi:hypothetical protein
MSFITADVWRAFASETTKLAAPRQLREVRKLFSEGKVDAANALTRRLQDAGVLKVTDEGSLVRELGSGAEGLAETVVGARDQPARLAVRKTYSQEAPIYVPGQEDRKVQIGDVLRGNRDFAEIYTRGQARTNRGGFKYMLKEYVPGQSVVQARAANPAMADSLNDFARQAERQANTAAQSAGLPIKVRDVTTPKGDVQVANRGNTIIGRDGRPKVVDFIADDPRAYQSAMSTGRVEGGYYPNLTPQSDRANLRLNQSEVRRIRQSFGKVPTPIAKRNQVFAASTQPNSAAATQPLSADTTPLTGLF